MQNDEAERGLDMADSKLAEVVQSLAEHRLFILHLATIVLRQDSSIGFDAIAVSRNSLTHGDPAYG